MKLYELAASYQSLLDRLTDDDVNLDAIKDTLECIDDAIEVKAANAIAMLRTLQSYALTYEAEEKRFKAMRETTQTRIDWLKNYIKSSMEAMQKEKIVTGKGTLAIHNNARGAVTIENADLIPAQFIDIIPEQRIPNNQRIYEAFKAGQAVPGATYTVGTHLRVR